MPGSERATALPTQQGWGKWKKRRERQGKPVPRNLKSFSVREDYSDLWQHRLTPSQMILDARYSMMGLVWREAGCKLCDLRDHPEPFLYLMWCHRCREIGVTLFILCQTSLLCSQAHLHVLNAAVIRLETHLDDLQWCMSTPEAFAKSLLLFTLLDKRRSNFHTNLNLSSLKTLAIIHL